MNKPQLIGRSSSHFTRVARIFAAELGVEHEFQIVRDLTSADVRHYADNPALKIPVLVDAEGPLFGAENICRAFAQRSAARAGVVLRGECASRAVMNAEGATRRQFRGGGALLPGAPFALPTGDVGRPLA